MYLVLWDFEKLHTDDMLMEALQLNDSNQSAAVKSI